MEGLSLLLWALSFAPQNVTIDFPVVITNASITSPDATLQAVASNCTTVCTAAWAAAGFDGVENPVDRDVDDPENQLGDGCQCFDPGRKKRLDGSEL